MKTQGRKWRGSRAEYLAWSTGLYRAIRQPVPGGYRKRMK